MTVKYKTDKKASFKGARDIRKHEWDDLDYDVSFTDSTSPFDEIVAEIREPGMEYYFALNAPERLDRLYIRHWRMVDPDRLTNKRNFTTNSKKSEDRDSITTGDTILLERPARFGDKEKDYLYNKNIQVVRDGLKPMKTDIYNVANPFAQ
jgi:hypothetical protein